MSIETRVTEILDLVEDCCAELYDPEFATACRRFLAWSAREVPGYYQRIRRAEPTAAAICWIVHIGNLSAWYTHHGPMTKDVLAHLGVPGGTPSYRASVLLGALGFRYDELAEDGLSDEFRISRR